MAFKLPLRNPDALYIGGAFLRPASGDTEAVINPATEEVLALAPNGGAAEVEAAIASARSAFDNGVWPGMTAAARTGLMRRMHDALMNRAPAITELIVLEVGAVRAHARARQFDVPMKHYAHFLEIAHKASEVTTLAPERTPAAGGTVVGTAFVVREPVGVIAAITPYNYPYFLNIAKVVPALLAGNTVVLKPSPYTPFQALLLAEAADEAGLPPGVLNVITGDKAVGERLTTDPRIDMVSFTGSDAVGAAISAQAAPTLKRLVMELGGKSALIVRADANRKMALSQALRGFTSHAGQGCAMNTRCLVHNSLRAAFVEELAAMARALRVGDTADPASEMGPLIRSSARDRVEHYVALGRDSGAKLMAGGRRPPQLQRGYFYEPTLFDGVDPQTAIAQDEIFGPVGVVIGFDTDEEAVRIANDSRYGLRGGIISADVGKAYEMALRIRSGGLTINAGAGTQLSNGPFGGVKRSGYGRELGEDGLREFTQTKLIEIQAA